MGKKKGERWLEHTFYRSSAPTHQPWHPWGQPDNAWSATKIIGSMPISWRYFDREGNELNAAGAIIAEVQRQSALRYLEPDPDETAWGAVQRYQAFFDSLLADMPNKAAIAHHRLAFHGKKVKASKVAKAEKRLGVTLPPSWVSFVTKHGLFRFGDGPEAEMLDPGQLRTLTERLELEWELDPVAEFDLEDAQSFDQAVPFAFGDAGLQLVYFWCFCLDTQNSEGEALVLPFNQDDPLEFATALAPDTELAMGVGGFDLFVSTLISDKIRKVTERFDIPIA